MRSATSCVKVNDVEGKGVERKRERGGILYELDSARGAVSAFLPAHLDFTDEPHEKPFLKDNLCHNKRRSDNNAKIAKSINAKKTRRALSLVLLLRETNTLASSLPLRRR